MTRSVKEEREKYRRNRPVEERLDFDRGQILVGKDVLELVTTAMHLDPITIYREYIQNAADAIDQARNSGILAPGEAGKVAIEIEPTTRSLRLRDNGIGIAWPQFSRRLTAIGASCKRGTHARGFRGVGRLAGLAYAQELIFRSRVVGDECISELRWDCRSLREVLRDTSWNGDIFELVRNVVTCSRFKNHKYPQRFFEVELKGVVRVGSDRLLNSTAIAEYLAQVAPVPFAPYFSFGTAITKGLSELISLAGLEVHITGINGPVYRPHRESLSVDKRRTLEFDELEVVKIPSTDGRIAAIGWILHHKYEGAVPAMSLVGGLRLRCGNLQVGDHTLLDRLFPEPRFNSWAVGEVHVLDDRIVPNGRRDNFELDVHYSNLLNHLAPIARSIAKRCRVSSRRRHLLRKFACEEASARDCLSIIEQGTLPLADRTRSARSVKQGIERMEGVAEELMESVDSHCYARITALQTDLQRLLDEPVSRAPLAHLPAAKRRMYEHLFGLVYECSTNRVAAKALVDRILLRLQTEEEGNGRGSRTRVKRTSEA